MAWLTELWLPILLSAVFVFVASSIVHMVFRHHRTDYVAVPDEDDVRAAMNKARIGPGDYHIPYACGLADLKNPEMMKKFEEGPVCLLTVLPSGPPAMGKNLVQWFVYSLVVGILVAYVTWNALGDGADYMRVFRIAGVVAWLTYVGAAPIESIWKGRKWSSTIKAIGDGLVYSLLTAGTFGWLWPN